jgi:hypothetical protein
MAARIIDRGRGPEVEGTRVCATKRNDVMRGNVRHEAHRWNEGKPLKPVLGRRQAFEP